MLWTWLGLGNFLFVTFLFVEFCWSRFGTTFVVFGPRLHTHITNQLFGASPRPSQVDSAGARSTATTVSVITQVLWLVVFFFDGPRVPFTHAVGWIDSPVDPDMTTPNVYIDARSEIKRGTFAYTFAQKIGRSGVSSPQPVFDGPETPRRARNLSSRLPSANGGWRSTGWRAART